MDKLKAFANPFYRASSAEILLFFAGWGIWWVMVATIYAFAILKKDDQDVGGQPLES